MRLKYLWLSVAAACAACAAATNRGDGAIDAVSDRVEVAVIDAPAPPPDVVVDDAEPPPDSTDAPDPGLPFGSPCTRDAECTSRVCVGGPGLTPGCGLPCTRDTDCEAFGALYNCAVDRPPGGAPARFTCGQPERGTAVAGDTCRLDGDCVTNLCVDGSCRGACVDDTTCHAGLRCGGLEVAGATLRTCRAAAITAPVVEDYVLFEGSARVDAVTPTFPLQLPSDAVSVTFTIQDLAGNELLVSVSNLQAPDGTLLINSRTWTPLMDQPIREVMFNRQVNSAQGPSSDTLRMRPGRYGVNFSIVNPRGAPMPVTNRNIRCMARIKRAPMGVFASGTLHLRVYLVGAPGGMTVATAPSNARLTSAVARLNAALGAVGVRVVVDGYSEITGADSTRLGTIDSRDELGELLSRSRGVTVGDVLNVFLVRGISPGAGLENAIGVAGDLVGPAGIHGTLDSGVVAAWDTTLGGGRDLLGQVMAHEAGHYLGLWHTRESRPPCTTIGQMDCSYFGGFDPITDTPTDDASSQMYLMHWSTSSGMNVRISPGQAIVLRANVLVR